MAAAKMKSFIVSGEVAKSGFAVTLRKDCRKMKESRMGATATATPVQVAFMATETAFFKTKWRDRWLHGKGAILGNGNVLSTVCLLVFALFSAGCVSSTGITWKTPPQTENHGHVVYLKPCVTSSNSVTNHVGDHTFTLFAIPCSGIYADRPVCEAVADAVSDAFKAAGYDVKPYASGSPDGLIVEPTIERFYYSSYSWLWPFMFNSGDISIRVNLYQGDSSPWSRTYEQDSFWMTCFGSWGFSTRIQNNMTEFVIGIHGDVASGLPRGTGLDASTRD